MGTTAFDKLFEETPEPQKKRTAFDSLFEQDEQNRRQESARVRTLVNGVQHSPEQASEALTLSRRTGVPADVALRNLDPLRQMASVEEFDADTFVRENPATSRWLQADPINPAIARDDLGPLTETEKLFGRNTAFAGFFSGVSAVLSGAPSAPLLRRPDLRPAVEGVLTTRSDRGMAIAMRGQLGQKALTNSMTEQDRIDLAAVDALLAQPQMEVSGVGAMLAGTAEILPSLGASIIGGGVGSAIGAAALGTTGFVLGGPLGAVAGAAKGATIGAGLGAFATSFSLEGGNATLDFLALKDEQGRPMDPAVARTGGAAVGLLAGSLDALSFGVGTKVLGSGFRDIVAGGIAEALRERGVRQALTNGVVAWGKTVGTEVATETAQQGVALAGEQLAREWSNLRTDTEFTDIPGGRVGKELAETAVQTFVSMALIGVPGGAVRTVADLQRISQAKRDGEVIEALAEQAGMSKLRQRDPAKYEELVRLQTPESLERVGIDAEKLTMLLQEQSVPLAQFAQVAGITEQDITEALARGGDVYIPTQNLLARLVGTPVFDAMKMDLRIRPDGLTQREADEQAKTLEADQKAVEAEMQEIVKNGAKDASGQRVIDDITAQITAATAKAPKGQRFTPENIEATARGIAAFFITTAERTGQDAFALYQSRNYRIVGRETAEPLYDLMVEARQLEKSGKKPERLAQIRGEINQMMRGMSVRSIRAEREAKARQVVGEALSETGKARRKLSDVTTDALAIAYIGQRDALGMLRGQMTALEETAATEEGGSLLLTVDESPAPEDAFGVLERSGFGDVFAGMSDAESFPAKMKAFYRGLRKLESEIAVAEKNVARLEAELLKRDIEDVDFYASERDLIGDTSFEFGVDDAERFLSQAAFHGTPYTFDRFLLSKIGTGEGAQAYGWGLYFAESQDVAEGYRKTLSENVFTYNGVPVPLTFEAKDFRTAVQLVFEANGDKQKALQLAQAFAARNEITQEINKLDPAKIQGGGSLYRVDIPDEAVARMLDWDKPLSEQAPEVREALTAIIGPERDVDAEVALIERANAQGVAVESLPEYASVAQTVDNAMLWRMTGEQFYRSAYRFMPDQMLEHGGSGQREASLALLAAGIPGIKYLDAGSRGAGDGTRNLVVFDENLVTITHRNGEPVTAQERVDFLAQAAMPEQVTTDVTSEGLLRQTPSEATQGRAVGAALPETLEVDGVSRPTRNSTGQPIHPTEEGVRNFWRWFGDSKVVDAEGRPLVVYHGTRTDITEFQKGSWFSTDPREASAYTEYTDIWTDARAFDAFIRKVKQTRADGTLDGERVGYYGIIADVPRDGKVYATDYGVVRKNADGTTDFFVDVVAEDGTFDMGDMTIALTTGDGQEFYDQELADVQAATPRRNDATGSVLPVYLRIVNPKEMGAFDANVMADRTGGADVREQGIGQVVAEGFDGIKTYSDDGAFFHGTIIDQYVVTDGAQVKSVFNTGEFGPTANILRQGAGRPNAFIMQGVSQKTIAMMNGADLSSLLHEFSHDWLEILGDLSQRPNATEQTQADYAAILKYLGVESRDQIGVPEQEKFARSFERWLATAEAPSRGLARAFVRFKSWMQRIYRMAQEMLVPVDPAIADVFARMLATDEELAQVRGQIGAEPMFTDAESAGKTPQEMADYQRKVELRTAEETGALLSALLREKSEEAKKIRREREKEIRAEVEAEVAERPVYQVVRDLTTNAKLDLTDLEVQFGDAIKSSLPRGVTASEGDVVPVDVIALRYGFRDGTAVVAALQDAKRNTEKQEVNRIVRERMAQEFPDPMERSDVMRMEAQKAAHRSETDDVLLDELRTLSKSAGIRPPNVQAIKNVARQMLGKEQVKNIRPIVYQNAEATAARKAGEAWRSGDGAKAAFHKRQQLLNHILYREAVKATERVAVIERFARKQAQSSAQERLGKAGQPYLEATNAILDSYEFRRVSQTVLDRRAAIAEFVKQSEEENGVVPAIPESVIADAQVVNYRTLSYDAVEAVYETLKQIDHLAGLKNKLLTKQKQKTIEAAEAAIVESIEKHHDVEVRPPDYAPTTFKRLTDAVKKWDAWHVKPEFLFRWLDGEKPFGAVHSLLFQPIADAQNAEARMLKAAVPEIKRLFALIPKNLRKSYDKKLTGADIPAGFTKEQAVALALNWGNASNRLAVAEGFLDEAKTMPHLTPRQIQALLGTLTKAEWDFVQGVWDYIDSFWPEIADLQRRLVGVAPEKIGADPFVQRTADGETITLRGGYYPLAYDREYSWSQRKVDAKQAVQEMADGGFARKVTKHGHTEERVGSGGKPVNLRLSIFPSHIINVIHDLTHREAVIDVRRMSERPAVRAAITGTAGSHLYDSINPWLNRVAAEQNPPASPMEDLLGRARVGATMVNMGFKVTTAVVQPLGYLQSVDLLGVKYARRGMQDFLKSPKQIWNLVKEWSPELESRRTQFDRDVKDAVDKLGVEGWKPEVMQTAFAMTGLFDMFVAVPTFYGAYLKSMEVLDPGNHEAAVKYAESVVRQSQSAGGAKDLAMVQGGAESRRMFTMFYSYFSVLYNLFRRSGSMLAQKGVSDLPRFAGSMALLWFLPSVISELIAQRGPEDDEDELLWTLEQIARYPFASVVGVRDVAGGLASYLTEGQMFYDISPVVSAFEAPIRATGGAIEAVGGEPMSRAEVKAAVEAAGYWGKLPSRQMWITGEALYDWMMGYDIAPQDLLFPRPR